MIEKYGTRCMLVICGGDGSIEWGVSLVYQALNLPQNIVKQELAKVSQSNDNCNNNDNNNSNINTNKNLELITFIT